MTLFFGCLKLVYGGLRVTKEVEYMNKMCEIACCRRLDDRGTSYVHRKRQTSNKTVDRTPRTVNKVNYDRYQ